MYGLLAAVLMASMFWASGRAPSGGDGTIPLPRGPLGNVLHVVAFAALGLLLVRALDLRGEPAGWGSAAGKLAVAIAAAWGIVDEIHQYFTPGRVCSSYDVVLDLGGAVIATLVPHRRGSGRPRSPWPAVAGLVAALAIALGSGTWRPPGDDLIERVLAGMGFPAP